MPTVNAPSLAAAKARGKQLGTPRNLKNRELGRKRSLETTRRGGPSGQTDVLWRHPDTLDNVIWNLNNGSFASQTVLPKTLNEHQPEIGNFDADPTSEISGT